MPLLPVQRTRRRRQLQLAAGRRQPARRLLLVRVLRMSGPECADEYKTFNLANVIDILVIKLPARKP